MQFSVLAQDLIYWIFKASTALGGGKATESVNGFIFREFNGFLQIICTDKISFSFISTSVALPSDFEPLMIPSGQLFSFLNITKSGLIVFKREKSQLYVTCGLYSGFWNVSSLQLMGQLSFPVLTEIIALPSVVVHKQKFIYGVEKVKYVLEGVMGGTVSSQVIFKENKSIGSSPHRQQIFETGLGEDFKIFVPLEAFGVVKFLNYTLPNAETFIFSENDKYLCFSDGVDFFVCDKKKSSIDGTEAAFVIQQTEPQVSCVLEKDVLWGAAARVSLTAEKWSAEVCFDIYADKIVLSGKDRYGNSGFERIEVNVQECKHKVLGVVPLERTISWIWLSDAIKANEGKVLTLYFGQTVLIIEGDKGKAIIGLVSKQRVKRT